MQGKIVVDQRIDVDRLDRGADTERPRPRAIPNRRAPATVRSGPKPLAAADRRMPHGFEEDVATVVARDEQAVEQLVDFAADRSASASSSIPSGDRSSQPASKGVTPDGRPSAPNAICSIRSCAAFSRASQ